jgi:histidyl-tRNA synthetase
MTVEEMNAGAFNDRLDLFIAPLGEEARRHGGTLARDLRRDGISVEVSTDNKLKRALEIANKIGARFALMVGENEMKAGEYQLKNMVSGEQTAVSREQIAEAVQHSK